MTKDPDPKLGTDGEPVVERAPAEHKRRVAVAAEKVIARHRALFAELAK